MTTPPPPATPAYCTACGAELRGRFCTRCGAPATAAPPTAPAGGRNVWIASAVVVVLSALVIVWTLSRPATRSPGGPVTEPGATFAGPAPDISNITPREGFDRLFNRVMMAAEQGDTATVVQFTEHALGAYTQLDSLDDDARYHAAVLNAGVGRYPAALALADTILAGTPTQLLGFVIRGEVASLTGDQAALARARRDFLAAWPAESDLARSGYGDHRQVLDQFRATADSARSGR